GRHTRFKCDWSSDVCSSDLFEAGKVYQVVYTTRGSSIVGLRFAAVRDIVSFLKYAAVTDGNPCAGTLDYAYAFGASQSGRFLRRSEERRVGKGCRVRGAAAG